MILSDKTIKDYIAQKKISFFPDLDFANIRPTGVRLHLGHDLLVPAPHQRVGLKSEQEIKFDRVSISHEAFVLHPGQFVLGSTLERFQVPRDIVCHVDGRSTVARVGLAIHCTSGIIDGNFEEARTIVLEMKNQGPFEIVLAHGDAVAQLSFTQLSTPIEQSAQAQYQGQHGTVPPNFKAQKR